MSKPKRKSRAQFFDTTENNDRWLVSYADFITLLFAFFVVMYSISSVNDKKYNMLSQVLNEAFSDHDAQKRSPIKPIPTDYIPEHQPIFIEKVVETDPEQQQITDEILKERRLLELISQQFKEVLAPYIDDELITIKKQDFWIELEMNSQLLFLSGEANLANQALPILKKVANIVRRMNNTINIEGHTDNVPINTRNYPSNWDLSSARATRVVREIIKHGISPQRLSAIGYGEFHPIASNKTNEGRIKNRRVVLVLVSPSFARYGMSDKQRAEALNLTPSETASE